MNNAIKNIYKQQKHSSMRELRWCVLFFILLLIPPTAQAQITIGGNVYGGGNEGDVYCNTSVTVRAGDINAVYGGARMADVGGSAFVNIDGASASSYILINKVYGGNDIAGNVGRGDVTKKKIKADILEQEDLYNIDNSWDAVIKLSTKMTADVHYTQAECDEYNTANSLSVGDTGYRTTSDVKTPGGVPDPTQRTYIGQLFAGGNGDYTIKNPSVTGSKWEIWTKDATPVKVYENAAQPTLPDLTRTYLEVLGGSIVYAYGGGNNATVTDQTIICVDNPSKVVNSIIDATNPNADANGELLTNERFSKYMGINLGFSKPSSDEFQIGRFFGGNNKADMSIIPKWHLNSGRIRNLYSGGNEGRMTSPTGILLTIDATSTIVIDNVYGGCRKSDVIPLRNGTLVETVEPPAGYVFPADFAARIVIDGGDINNVYGGNDISGKVYFGNAVGIRTSIRGDVYGGGNGSYPYTDNINLKDDPIYGDLYYDPGSNSLAALNAFRPNAEQVSIRLKSSSADNPTIIGGRVFVGGNSATLKKKDGATDYKVELKIGSHVYADKVFLGNNGENMVDVSKTVENDKIVDGGVLRIMGATVTPATSEKAAVVTLNNAPEAVVANRFNSIDLTNAANFATYMEGCALDMLPRVVFDAKATEGEDYVEYSSYFGSFYCGGNVGSMTGAGTTTLNLNHKVIVFDKLVGGCNNAFVWPTAFNALYEGGLTGAVDTETGNKLVLNISNLKIQPMRWAVQREGSSGEDYDKKVTDAQGNYTYLLTTGEHPHRYLEWNTVDSRYYDVDSKTYREMAPADPDEVIPESGKASTADDQARRLFGGNIYGGCYSSGIINGNVVINLNANVEDRETLFDEVKTDALGEEESLYGSNQTVQTEYTITKRHTGVILGQQGMDVFGSALNVFGGGHGKDTEIWGSTIINVNRGYTFQVFGGSEEGVIGKGVTYNGDVQPDYTWDSTNEYYYFNNKRYTKDAKYSCYVNLCGQNAGVSKAEDSSEDMAECEFIYGGGFFGPICGNTVINLGKGRVFNTFGGSCNGDILGTSRTYIGRQVKDEYKISQPSGVVDQNVFESGFPWIRDIVYGANDLGGRILGEESFKSQIRGQRSYDPSTDFDVYGKIHNPGSKTIPDVLVAGAYVEYLQGRADAIFGGCYGTYDYKDSKFARYIDENTGEPLIFPGTTAPKFFKPRLNNAIVNFRPTYTNTNNVVNRVYGAGQGYSGEKDRDLMQNRSYVLIDIPQTNEYAKYTNMEVFGAGAWGGVGMKYTYAETVANNFDLDKASAIIDLVRGDIGAAYGASYEEGVTRRTLVNIPQGSTIKIGSIFGGGYGMSTFFPCDAYEAHVEYHSGNAVLKCNPERKDENGDIVGNKLQTGAIYGGNNNERRTLYAKVNIDVPVWQDHYEYGRTKGNVYGAGCGANTWAEYTEVYLDENAEVYEVYGGGQNGKIYNAESVTNYKVTWKPPTWPDGTDKAGETFTDDDWAAAWKIGDGFEETRTDETTGETTPKEYWEVTATNLANPLVRVAEIDDRADINAITDPTIRGMVYKRYNANVIINEGATVHNYAYGGGYGADALVSGTTYIALLGGEVKKDIYASGTSGSVEDLHGAGLYSDEDKSGFKASANVYVKGGTVRNVYGGGWRGSVGHHSGAISNITDSDGDGIIDGDIDGESHVVIGDIGGTSHVNGIPSITRNVYGGGEGGGIYGDAYVTINNGYIGYRYNSTTGEYDEELDDDGKKDKEGNHVPNTDLERGGNVFGGGYVANSYCDRTHVTMWGGVVRGSLFGGGEIGPVGRGTVKADAPGALFNPDDPNNKSKIYKGGETHVTLYGGHVMRNVFGGGRGYDNWSGDGWMTDEEKLTMDRSSKGFVFGTTDVHIRGGEVGTEANALHGYGNVFGGGDEGFVYSSDGKKKGTPVSDDELSAGLPTGGGGYYYKGGETGNGLSLCCNVVIEPWCKVKTESISFTDYVKDASGNFVIETTGDYEGLPKKGDSPITFTAGEYVPVEYLAQLRNKSSVSSSTEWAKLNTDGVTIHNAVFAGGNITPGSDIVYANTVTVYGNAAASLRDVYNRDLISVGTDDIGGLYGDGNLTRVDGFRELHIDNYGTDFYSLSDQVDWDTYDAMSQREKAYYQLKYICNATHTYSYYESQSLHVVGETAYKKGQKVTAATYETFSTTEQANWYPGQKEYKKDDQIDDGEYGLMDPDERATYWDLGGVFSKYAGRPLNTIQRADFCGVFGSRMVLKGAEDRASKVTDYANYTINRVDELSLNQNRTLAEGDGSKDLIHGNYFGVYSSVKFLGNLTSDVFFTDVRLTDTSDDALKGDGETTYYDWKIARPQSKYRNNGTSYNKVALASGVYLEIKREETETASEDKWGHISGVVELDLINVMPGMGGGYVYAKNEHGLKTYHTDYGKVSVLDYNMAARTYRQFTYDEGNKQAIETSGNFVHNTKQIVDDCYPNGGMYNDVGYVKSPAHYWYIKGSIYVYDQYISAYTGSATAYAERIELPLTITAAANGRMTLREVQPNYYAYYDKNGNKLGTVEETFKVNDKVYRLNDPISYWDYRLLSEADKTKFEKETYVTSAACTVGTTPNPTTYAEGSVLTAVEYNALKEAYSTVTVTDGDVEKTVPFDEVFHMSNNMSHNTGYVLTYDVNNPMIWNDYYTKTASPGQANSLNTDEYKEDKESGSININDYTEGPTFSPNTSGVYGQYACKLGDIINANTYAKYQAIGEERLAAMRTAGQSDPTKKQATVSRARVMTSELSVTDTNGNEIQRLYPGTSIAEGLKYTNANGIPTAYTTAQWTAIVNNSAAAKVCTSYIEFSTSDYVYAGQLLSPDDIVALKDKVAAKFPTYSEAQVNTYIAEHTSDAYYCVDPGLYGGSYFEAGKAYRAIDTWSAMNETDRAYFNFNYDAFDVLIDPTYSGRLESNYGQPKVQYDGYQINTTDPLHTGDRPLATKIYSPSQKIDYQAEYTGENSVSYKDKNNVTHTISKPASESDWLSRSQYEDIPNEKHHYSPITVDKPGTYYVVNTAFMRGDIPYSVGQMIEAKDYQALNDQQRTNVDALEFTKDHINKNESDEFVSTNYFYCREPYTVNEKGEGVAVTTMGIKAGTRTYNENQEVPKGVIINQTNYDNLKNYQAGFLIHGLSPTEVSTLYVSSESNIEDLTKEKIITVIYLYEYEESDESGFNVTPVSERHIVNIHINFKSGVPEIGELNKPSIVLPGTTIGLEVPSVSEGAFRVTSSGWELFSNQNDAETHYNGKPYYNTVTPVYWYQNNYWIAYYAETNHGRAYSNAVKVSVANYHDLKKVMDDKLHHYYIDHKDVDYEPKIYLNDYTTEDPETSESGLDMLKNLIDLSYLTKDSEGVSDGVVTAENALKGHALLDTSRGTIKGGNFLEFFLRADQKPKGESWTPIANNEDDPATASVDEGECFEGILHGDGHTISGLNNSLFGHLCGNVYNLGVTGSFTGAGVAETGTGYVENCWVNTSGTPTTGTGHYAVFGNPSRTTGDNQIQVVNCYYPQSNAYTVPTGDAAAHGVPISKPDNAFYNGEVAYDLNGFYLYKRYSDHETTSGASYQYYTGETDPTTDALIPSTAYYASNPDLCSSGYTPEGAAADYIAPKYVEDRFADGDFVYADGSIPGSNDERLTVVNDKNEYYPIWPHDYIFFGQSLSYDHMDGKNGRDLRTHQPLPSTIVKSGNRIQTNIDGNRVYRAPAYFRSKQMGVAHFNPYAVFAQTKKGDATLVAHKDMTAIDFTGSNGDVDGGYNKGLAGGKFYPPLLDDDGLHSIYNADLTRNLLVYTMTSTTAAAQTDGVVASYLPDAPYTETATAPVTALSDNTNRYHTVGEYDFYKDDIRGHRVQKQSNGTFLALNDHLLIDKQDFNAPIAYSFDSGQRMWYQRKPTNYVGKKEETDGTITYDNVSGWEGISLPFKAEIVTTDEKGEITHFYDGSNKGHEYWLREFGDGGTTEGKVYKAKFGYPEANAADGSKNYTNTFLWDYYYSYNNYDDLNSDDYQEADADNVFNYYKTARTYANYPRLAAATPYIIGFPSERYYEFDLSGNFEAQTAKAQHIDELKAQTITFASKPGDTSIGVSDDEMTGVTEDGYTFKPSYLNSPDVTENNNGFPLNADGNSFVENSATTVDVAAFRPYFEAAKPAPSPAPAITRSIIFGGSSLQLGGDEQESQDNVSQSMEFYAKKHKIVVTSHMLATTDVAIFNVSGMCIASFDIEPGETIETPVNNGGVYIVRAAGGHYTKKVSMK